MESLQELYQLARSFWVVWLMILFIGIIWWAFRPKNRGLEDHASIPLNDD
ncbi:cbb3-type cytochrome c oxidase subunit 3 [Magnetospira sp. QH-2]|nr:cbb3-type cytochrome c oxidase subunit 3 [Magnetospira sp. QH-2]CCQ72122.1 Cytochrome c oxidase fixQ chain [Magnetospira sp. QH-2]